ncbi:MAG: trehalose-phosphatase [Micromonosporaceae bacterium]|nr:trehalose-phosphatase [Micromonosporaceae bacterium]
MLPVSPPATSHQTHHNMWDLTARRAGQCGCFFDFDGTLAPIGDDPEAVAPVPGTLDALGLLADRVKRVVIVSARPVDFLRRQLGGVPLLSFFGLYGLEWQTGSEPVRTHPEAEPYQSIMKGLAAEADQELPAEVLVEYKRLSVALHYRMAPHLRTQIEQWAAGRGERHQLRVQAGRMVVELKPPIGRDKGSVVAEQIRDLSCAWYFGDDLSDLRAFAALDARQSADPSFLGVRVSVANAESGHALRPVADLCLDAPERVPGFLTDMVTVLAPRAVTP